MATTILQKFELCSKPIINIIIDGMLAMYIVGCGMWIGIGCGMWVVVGVVSCGCEFLRTPLRLLRLVVSR